MDPIKIVEQSQVRQLADFVQSRDGDSEFYPGDTLRVNVRVVEGGRERLQPFEGVVLRRHANGVGSTFTIRRVSFGVGMERTFPLYSPRVESIEVVRRGSVRRAKLYYLRGRSGKGARIAERSFRNRPS